MENQAKLIECAKCGYVNVQTKYYWNGTKRPCRSWCGGCQAHKVRQ